MQGSGRTDSKVHALGQVAHFETTSTLPIGRIQQALNAQVPRSISVRACADVSMEFHACHSAIGKRYLYLLAVGKGTPWTFSP
jgi:tRNA pseudouridine38-40 synthase